MMVGIKEENYINFLLLTRQHAVLHLKKHLVFTTSKACVLKAVQLAGTSSQPIRIMLSFADLPR